MKHPACLAFVALVFAPIHDSSAQSNPQLVQVESDPLPIVEVHPDRTVLPADQIEPSAPQTVGPGFQTIGLQDQLSAFGTGSIPPDTMGAIGPQHFVQVINGSVAIYNRTNGTRLSHVTLNAFFTATFDDVLYPRTRAFDPRVLYDRRSGRWFASAVEEGDPSLTENHVLLAVSESSDPTGAWHKYLIPFGEPDDGSTTFFADYATLGTDDNGVYLAVRIFPSSGSSFVKIAAMRKTPLLGGSAATITFFSDITDMFSVPQPATNFDALDPSDPTWFIASSPFAASASGRIYYRTLTWSGDTPILDSSSEFLNSPEVGTLPDAPASGSDTDVDTGDKRLLMAAIRNNRLWTCRTIGVDSDGDGGNPDRTACEWFELDLSGGTPSIAQRGRVFDNSNDPFFYYYPSIMVNGQGHAAMGFSGSRGNSFISAYFTGRLANDAADTMGSIELLKAGEAAYERLDGAEPPRNRWGDYSYTSLDPNNDMTLWTIQEYAENSTFNPNVWGTWVTPLFAPAPTLNNPLIASAAQGDTAVTVTLTGTGFYDPGDAFPARLNVTLTGGSPNGISNYSVSYLNPTEAEITFDIDPAAEAGFRDIFLTNPDGQSATAIDAFEILSIEVDIGVTLSANPDPVLVGEPLVYTVTVTNHEPLTAGNVVAI
ncbi:MAG TPA: hypothetical protein VMS21_04760, partial [Methylomirabilota bacterium]|nr:hypothetical protein [Methylomirabilota bacterium]